MNTIYFTALFLTTTVITCGASKPPHIFYTLYTPPGDATRVKHIVNTQLHNLTNKIHVFSSGLFINVTAAASQTHRDVGTEAQALTALHNYCKQHPNNNVIYLHSKGSFHNTPENEKFRRFLSNAALSDDCRQLPAGCNICSARFSPLPHPHTPGNMWLARCSYVRHVVAPEILEANMASRPGINYCVGKDRYAYEHWVHSHPWAAPCDLSPDSLFKYGYDNIPTKYTDNALAMAPRFPLQTYIRKVCKGVGLYVEERIEEYNMLYDQKPRESWWGYTALKYGKYDSTIQYVQLSLGVIGVGVGIKFLFFK